MKSKTRRFAILGLLVLASALITTASGASSAEERANDATQANAKREITISGMVKEPGKLTLKEDERITLGEVIKRAGGFVKYSSKRHIRVKRLDEKGKVSTYVKDLSDSGNRDGDFPIEPGDVIYVPEIII